MVFVFFGTHYITTLYKAIWHYTTLYKTIQQRYKASYTTLYDTIQRYTRLYDTMQDYTTLYYTVVCRRYKTKHDYTTLYKTIRHYTTLYVISMFSFVVELIVIYPVPVSRALSPVYTTLNFWYRATFLVLGLSK
jgi:hypothetical protein